MVELILLKTVDTLGKVGEIVTVTIGYAKNYLIPKGLAMRATDKNKNEIESMRKSLVEEDRKLREKALKQMQDFAGKHFSFVRNARNDGKLYGSVSPREIATHLSSDNITLKSHNVMVDSPILSTGIHEVQISLYPGELCKIFVVVAENESRCNNLIDDAKKNIVEAVETVNLNEESTDSVVSSDGEEAATT